MMLIGKRCQAMTETLKDDFTFAEEKEGSGTVGGVFDDGDMAVGILQTPV